MKEGALLSPLTLYYLRELYDVDTNTCSPIQAVLFPTPSLKNSGNPNPKLLVLSTKDDGAVVQLYETDEPPIFLPYITLNCSGSLAHSHRFPFTSEIRYFEAKGWLGRKDALVPTDQTNYLMSSVNPEKPEVSFGRGTCVGLSTSSSMDMLYVLKPLSDVVYGQFDRKTGVYLPVQVGETRFVYDASMYPRISYEMVPEKVSVLSLLNLDDVRELYDSKTDTCRPIRVVALYTDQFDKLPIVLSASGDGIHVRFWLNNTEQSSFLSFTTLKFNGALGSYYQMFGYPGRYSQTKGWLGQKDAKVPPNKWNYLMSESNPGWPEAVFLDGTCIYPNDAYGAGTMRRYYVLRSQ